MNTIQLNGEEVKTAEYTFYLTGDRDNTEDAFATWVVEKYGETALAEWVMHLIDSQMGDLYDWNKKMSNEEFDKAAEEIYRRHR